MLQSKSLPMGIVCIILLSLLINGCNMLHPSKKPDIGPAGTAMEEKSNPPLTERFSSPPGELYDLETTAGLIFEGIINNDWLQATTSLTALQTLWLQSKLLIGDKKGVLPTDAALEKLTTAIAEKNPLKSFELLNNFMSGITDIGKSYKLSPLAGIIGIDNGIRRVCFYVGINDWHKAASKMKELDSIWGQTKPSIESIGILGKLTTTHSIIKQMKDAVDAENKDAVTTSIANLNENMAYIRDYYRGK